MTATLTKNHPRSLLLTEELYRLIGRTRRLLFMAAARAMDARGQSIFTWQVLCYVLRAGPTAQRDLAYFTAQDPGGISRVVDDLLARGLVRRRTDPSDRRKLLVEATAKGRAWSEAASPEVMSRVEQVLGPLSVRQRQQLRDLLEALLDPDESR
ncbi:MAG: MarR family transcriptional regulator [Myxococcales bacterium]|nr:MarR family transcriptional regulator [Myxococcales bacterium]